MNWPSTPGLRLGSIPMLPLEMPPDCVPWCGACLCGFFCQAIAALNFLTVGVGVSSFWRRYCTDWPYTATCLDWITYCMYGSDCYITMRFFSIVHFRSSATVQSCRNQKIFDAMLSDPVLLRENVCRTNVWRPNYKKKKIYILQSNLLWHHVTPNW